MCKEMHRITRDGAAGWLHARLGSHQEAGGIVGGAVFRDRRFPSLDARVCLRREGLFYDSLLRAKKALKIMAPPAATEFS